MTTDPTAENWQPVTPELVARMVRRASYPCVDGQIAKLWLAAGIRERQRREHRYALAKLAQAKAGRPRRRAKVGV